MPTRTTSKIHYETAADYFKKLYEKGEFVEKTSEQYYDEEVLLSKTPIVTLSALRISKAYLRASVIISFP